MLIPGGTRRGARGLTRPTGRYLFNPDSPQARDLRIWMPVSPHALAGFPVAGAYNTGDLFWYNGVERLLTADTGGGAAGGVLSATDPRMGWVLDCSAGSGSFTLSSTDWGGSTNACSLSCWVRSKSKASYNGFFSSDSSSVGFSLLVSGGAGNPLGYVWTNDTLDYNAASGLTLLTDGHWQLIVITISPTAGTLYAVDEVNGFQSFANTEAHSAMDFTGKSWYVGKDRATGSSASALIADCRVYRRTLTPQDVWSLYDPASRWDLYWVPSSRVFFDIGASLTAAQQIGIFDQQQVSQMVGVDFQ